MGESIVEGVKIACIIAATLTFFVLLNNLIALISAGFFGESILSEIFGVMSLCLPFDASSVFGSIMLAINAIIAVLVGRWIYDATVKVYR